MGNGGLSEVIQERFGVLAAGRGSAFISKMKNQKGMFMERQYVDDLVSVIIPLYNAEKYIGRAIESVLSQTYQNYEIVVVDDCSRDRSARIVKGFAAKDGRVKYYRQEKNMGAGHTRNYALSLAHGKYIAFLDSDDEWLPDKIRWQLKRMKETHTPFCYTAIEMIDKNGRTIKTKRHIKETCNYNDLLHNTVIATSSVLVDRGILGDFRMPLRRGGQDYATWLKLLRNGVVAYGIDKALVRYRLLDNSLSSNKFHSIRQVWEIQTKDEGIKKIPAAFHVCCFVVNAVKKYLF